VLLDAGHFVWDDQPQKAAATLVEFLQRQTA